MKLAHLRENLFPSKGVLASVEDWRRHVLDVVIGALLFFGTLVAIPSIVLLVLQGLWPAAVADIVLLAIGTVLWRNKAISFRLRSWSLCGILYLLGLALLLSMGPTSQIYLMTAPAMGAILLGPWPAIWIMAGSSVTLFWVGYLGYSNFQIPGLSVDPMALWLTITLNFVFVNAVITLTISLLLRGLETSFASLAEAGRAKLEFLDTSLDSIISMDAEGCISEWSHQAEVMLGWSFAEVRGQFLHDLIIPQRYREGHLKGIAHYLATGVGRVLGKRMEMFALRRDGTEFPIELAISPIVTPQGTSFSAFIRDVTERKKEQEALVSAKSMAERANQSKSEFLANMSHEIRTPMNGVIGMVDILQSTPLLPEQQRMLGTIQQSSMALLQILNDILDFSKIEAGKLTVESIPTRLSEVATGAVQLIEAVAQGKRLKLTVLLAPALPDWTLSDPARLRQVLLNLLGNAAKFSANASGQIPRVALRVAPCVRSDGSAGVQLCVEDNGIGISAEGVAKLFQPFTQADEGTARKFGGTGLGLSICQRLVELMGGTLTVRSALGEGSEFCVELPLLPCEPGQAQPVQEALAPMPSERRATKRYAAPTVEQAAQGQRLILLAEDNETNREVMQEQLRLLGHSCEMAEDGVIALRMLQANPGRYALLLSDCNMPNLDGFGLTAAIRASEPQGTHLPIIAITANAMQGVVQRCHEHGMDDYLSKPLRMKELAPMLDKWLPQPFSSPDFPVWNPITLSELVGDNPGMHKRLLGKFLLSAEKQVAQIVAGAAASDTATVGGAAHTLKSSARSVGALALGELCQAIEAAGHAGDAHTCSALAQGMPQTFAAATQAINQHLAA